MGNLYDKVIVPMDGSKLAECVLPHLEVISRSCLPGAFELVRVVNPVEYHIKVGVPISAEEESGLIQGDREEAEAYLKLIQYQLANKEIIAGTKVLFGQTANTLIDYIEETGADLVIISTHGRSGPSRWVFGSIADRLLHGTCTPVLMVRAPGCVPGV
jgi:nucleotide-binding universal stress UspA family protein